MAISLVDPEDAVMGLSDEQSVSTRAWAADNIWSSLVFQPRYRVRVRLVRTEPAWFKPTVERLKHLLQLREDWDSYGAAPVDPRAARKALQLLALTTSLATPAPAVVPTVRGGLQLEWHQPDVDLEVEVPPSGPLRMTYENFVEGREWEGELRSNLAPLVEALAQLSRRG